ncbi:MAG TPA: FAD-binding oxidoreductase [Myxococcales bacterium]|nr:FAD-binding oxidoreductase [Myxococcales bacterium]
MRIPAALEEVIHTLEPKVSVPAAAASALAPVASALSLIPGGKSDAFSLEGLFGWDHLSPQSAPPIKGTVADDVSLLNKTKVNRVVRPKTAEDVAGALEYARAKGLKVSMAGARHSMGGQSLVENGVLLDMTSFNRMSLGDPAKGEGKTLRVQTGAMWSDVQKFLDERGLSVDVMQTPNFFTVGGTLSVNAHGSNPNSGPFSSTVQSLRVMLPSGEVKQCSRTENPELFKSVIGGYGLFGVVLDVDIKVRDNEMYKFEHKKMDYKQFPEFYKREIEGNDQVGYLHALFDVSPGKGFLRDLAVYEYTKDPGYKGETPAIKDDWMRPVREAIGYAGYRVATGGHLAKEMYWEALDKVIPAVAPKHTSRNLLMNEAFDGFRNDVSKNQTQIFQEYFIPRENIDPFLDKAREILQRYDANIAMAALRGVKKDDTAMMGYANQKDCFGFVMALQHDISDKNNEKLAAMTRELVDVARQFGGRNYLPYQLAYTPEQLKATYPETDAFLEMKQKYDPSQMFSNKWFQKYGDTSRAQPVPERPAIAPVAEGPIDWNAGLSRRAAGE